MFLSKIEKSIIQYVSDERIRTAEPVSVCTLVDFVDDHTENTTESNLLIAVRQSAGVLHLSRYGVTIVRTTR